ncbi:MAG: MBOAT family O-acyltransferase [Alistipes sp.]
MITWPSLDTWSDKIGALLTYDASSPLIFSSGLFLFLFTGFLFIYGFLRRATQARIFYVLLFSLYFYYKSSGIYFLLLVFAAISDYWIAKGIFRTENRCCKRWLVALSVVINLGMLGYFKYTNFLIGLSGSLFGVDFLQFQHIFLPVGISFFVFQSMSYTIDIYRGELKPLDRWSDYLFYLSFFPQLVAGPIVRARDFIPQIRQNPLVVTREMFGMGVCLILTGLFKKAIISDYISLNFVDRIFDEPLLYSGFECLMGIYGYALQIYCDFSGYSDMAIGIALLLGFRFPKNFDAPYKSATITEFWHRWHISLSTWLRDYLYISLGGNRKGSIRTYINLFITMLLGGLWHGAAIRFILWGALHGVALALHKMWLHIIPNAKAVGAEMAWGWRLLGIFFTFHLVCLGWLVFRADSMQTVSLMCYQIFHAFDAHLIPQVITGYAGVFTLILLGYLLHLLPSSVDLLFQRIVKGAPFAAQILLTAVMIWCVMQIKSSEIQPFIYFQF